MEFNPIHEILHRVPNSFRIIHHLQQLRPYRHFSCYCLSVSSSSDKLTNLHDLVVWVDFFNKNNLYIRSQQIRSGGAGKPNIVNVQICSYGCNPKYDTDSSLHGDKQQRWKYAVKFIYNRINCNISWLIYQISLCIYLYFKRLFKNSLLCHLLNCLWHYSSSCLSKGQPHIC